jgi:hypothetical protein
LAGKGGRGESIGCIDQEMKGNGVLKYLAVR